MNCWGHGPTYACMSGVCRDCQAVMSQGDGVIICEQCIFNFIYEVEYP